MVAFIDGLLVSLHSDVSSAQQPSPPTFPPDAFVHVRPDGEIVNQVNRFGIRSGRSNSAAGDPCGRNGC
jgi:hypothetical protein